MKPSRVEIKVDYIPKEIRDKPRWICWRWEIRNEKWTKPPYNPNTLKFADSVDLKTWATFDKALSVYKSSDFDGIGFILAKEYTGIDFDDSRDPSNGQILEPALSEITKLNSYTEISPSLKGFKTLTKATLPKGGHHGEKIGAFNNGRYFCITGHILPGISSDIESRQPEIDNLVKRFWPDDFTEEIEEHEYPQEGNDNDENLISRIKSSNQGAKFKKLWGGDWSDYISQSEADMALCSILAFWTENNPESIDRLFKMSGLFRDKWVQHRYNDRTIKKVIALSGARLSSSVTTYNKDSLDLSFSLYRKSVTCQKKKGDEDEKLHKAAWGLLRGGMDLQEASNYLEILVKSYNPSLEIGEIKKRSEEIIESVKVSLSQFKSVKNIAGEFRQWVKQVSNGQFLVSEYQRESAIVSKEDKHALIVAAKKLCDEGLIEKVGKRTGEYRIIDKDIEYMDFVNVSKDGSLPLTLPLEIHKKTIFFPRNVIVVAGVTGYGKTSFLLNVIRDNGHKFRFKYFASEMSNLALNYKLAAFRLPVEDWNKWMDVIPDYVWDHTNIQDKIFPNDMNMIDYLEPEGEKTYNIHDIITKIIKKLDKGMALISTQKRPGSELSAGGVYSAKAASLYLSMDWGKILIFKNRFREEDSCPTLTKKDFTIEPGQNFVASSDWYDPNPAPKKKEKSYDRFDKD